MTPAQRAKHSSASTFTLHHADLTEVLPTLPDLSVDVIITDPPYSAHVHQSVRSSGRNRGLTDGNGNMSPCATRRSVDLGFEHLSASMRRLCAIEFARLARRWVAVFSDVESCHLWRRSLEGAGLDYVRTLQWIRIGGAPQFTGDRPANGTEAITLAHRPGRKRWNGGGKAGVYVCPIVTNRSGHRTDRVHPTQKPIDLMIDLVDDFTESGEVVLDPFAGSGSTGVAALRRGREFVGIELMAEHHATALERLQAEDMGVTVKAARAGQLTLTALEQVGRCKR